MLKVEIIEAKNNEKTLKINDVFLHSSYSPTTEAQRFVQNFNPDFNFNNLFIIEPGLGYCIPLLQEKFPNTKIIVLKISKKIPSLFETTNSIYLDDFSNFQYLENFFYNNFTEIDLLTSYFINWPTSEKIFAKEINLLNNTIKSVLERCKTVLYTRGYFEKKWLTNCCNNLKYISKTIQIQNKTNLPVLIVASGPSLKNLIPFIKKNRNHFFILCVSSAINTLFYNDIIPDLCISTDGGFWAGKHLHILNNHFEKTILALPMEAYCPKEILSKSTILPLTYNDGISSNIEKQTGIDFYKAERNGTVTGTALKLALSITNNNIYFCGTDLHSVKGFQHTKPNKLETDKEISTNKLSTLCNKTIPAEFNNESLETYEKWFQMIKNQNKKLFRVIDKPLNSLNEIVDISSTDFINSFNSYDINKNSIFSTPNPIKLEEKKTYLRKINSYISKNCHENEWIENIFPLDYVSLIHCKNMEEKQKISEKIHNKNQKLTDNLNKILNFPDIYETL